MVLQPYVENAIIHGLLPKEGNRKLTIEINADGKNLKCIITDNGIGRTSSNELNKSRLKHHESTAMNLTKDRLAILNIETGNGVGPNVIDLFDEKGNSIGTRVELILPLIIQNDSVREI
jgi:sensor histidine kinase YesM